jgi:hypothetical protein
MATVFRLRDLLDLPGGGDLVDPVDRI